SQDYTTFVGANNYQIGFLAGQYAGRLLNGKGKIVEIQGLPGSTPAIERHKGFINALKNYPDIRIIAELFTDWTDTSASSQVEKIKPIAQQANLVFGQNDVMAHAAYLDYKLWGKEKGVKFIGVDASPGPNLGLYWVSKGILTASVLYPTGGKEAIDVAIQAAEGKEISRDIMLHTLVIDSTNVGLMKLQTDKILSQQSDIERQQNLMDSQLRIYKSQKNILYILLFTLIIAILLGSITYLSFRRNKQITKSLRLKNKEIVFQQNKVIEYANQAKDATEAKLTFFTNISHEFRTPLTLIFGAVEEISENKKYQGALKNQLALITKNAGRLFRMVNQLIDYRKVEVGKMKPQVSEYDMVSLLNDIISSFKGLSKKRNIDLRLDAVESPILLWFDPYMLDKVFFNLLSNAFKFTEDYGRINIALKYSEDRKNVIVEVDDNGGGISLQDKEQIFELFYQGKENKSKGFGLGLPLAKEFIRLHHGTLSLIDKNTPGATFMIELPVGKDHFQTDEIKVSSDIEHNGDFSTLDEFNNDSPASVVSESTGLREI
ncbi:MAG: sensor histidine kinase, partial [Chitinophagaceae bacterium]